MRTLVDQLTKSGGAVLLNSAAPSATASRRNGIAYDSTGKYHGTSAAPTSTSTITGGIAISLAGALHVSDSAPAASAIKRQGIAVALTGAVHVNSGTPGAVSFSGVSVDSTGRLYESGV